MGGGGRERITNNGTQDTHFISLTLQLEKKLFQSFTKLMFFSVTVKLAQKPVAKRCTTTTLWSKHLVRLVNCALIEVTPGGDISPTGAP